MENLTRHTPYTLPFAYLLAKLRNYLREKGEKMLCVKIKEIPGLFSNGVCCFFNFICNKLLC